MVAIELPADSILRGAAQDGYRLTHDERIEVDNLRSSFIASAHRPQLTGKEISQTAGIVVQSP